MLLIHIKVGIPFRPNLAFLGNEIEAMALFFAIVVYILYMCCIVYSEQKVMVFNCLNNVKCAVFIQVDFHRISA